jgi:hypothetical protein
MRLKDLYDDKILIIKKLYDEQGNLTSVRFADEERIHLSPQAASLIENSLARVGWTQIYQHPDVEDRGPTQIKYSVFVRPNFLGRIPPPIARLEGLQDDKIVIIERVYDNQGKLTSVRFADEERMRLSPQAASLIENSLARVGWTQLDQHSNIEVRGPTQIKYSVYFCPDFLGRIALPIERKEDGTLSARARLC